MWALVAEKRANIMWNREMIFDGDGDGIWYTAYFIAMDIEIEKKGREGRGIRIAIPADACVREGPFSQIPQLWI